VRASYAPGHKFYKRGPPGKDRKISSNESLDERLANESREDEIQWRKNMCVNHCVKYPKKEKESIVVNACVSP